MRKIFYSILQTIQALLLLFVIILGVLISWLKGDIKFKD